MTTAFYSQLFFLSLKLVLFNFLFLCCQANPHTAPIPSCKPLSHAHIRMSLCSSHMDSLLLLSISPTSYLSLLLFISPIPSLCLFLSLRLFLSILVIFLRLALFLSIPLCECDSGNCNKVTAETILSESLCFMCLCTCPSLHQTYRLARGPDKACPYSIDSASLPASITPSTCCVCVHVCVFF